MPVRFEGCGVVLVNGENNTCDDETDKYYAGANGDDNEFSLVFIWWVLGYDDIFLHGI